MRLWPVLMVARTVLVVTRTVLVVVALNKIFSPSLFLKTNSGLGLGICKRVFNLLRGIN